jgi:hypothetical protein
MLHSGSALRRCLLLYVSPVILCSLLALSAQAGPSLSPVKRTLLKKGAGRVDQVVPVADDGFLVRDADYRNEATQVLELYDADGYICGQFGAFGRDAGQYYRLKGVALAKDGTVWVADVAGRISRFNMAGWLIDTRLIQKPGYQIDGLALDEAHGDYYLSGCLPKKVYLNYGCQLVHQYSLGDDSYRRSFLETDQEALEKNLISLEDHQIDIDARGRVYIIDAPLLKVVRFDPGSGEVRTFPVRSHVATPLGPVQPGLQSASDAYQNAYLLDRVLETEQGFVVAVRKPKGEGFLLQAFDEDGRQVVTDLPSPGKLVGKTPDGHLLFAEKAPKGFEIAEYEFSAAARPK